MPYNSLLLRAKVVVSNFSRASTNSLAFFITASVVGATTAFAFTYTVFLLICVILKPFNLWLKMAKTC
jgi:hypothetical protein